jgi:hypothetical protein
VEERERKLLLSILGVVCDDDEKDDVSGLLTFAAAAGLENFLNLMSVVTIDDENCRFLSLSLSLSLSS